MLLTLINKYYAGDKSKIINERSFLSYAKNNKRFRGNITVRYKGLEQGLASLCLDITDIEELANMDLNSM